MNDLRRRFNKAGPNYGNRSGEKPSRIEDRKFVQNFTPATPGEKFGFRELIEWLKQTGRWGT